MTCDRCFQPETEGQHGEGVCPYEPRRGTAIIDDQIAGGARYFENLGHDRVWVESKSQLRDECRARGLQPRVEHRGVPGTDKSPQTSRWV